MYVPRRLKNCPVHMTAKSLMPLRRSSPPPSAMSPRKRDPYINPAEKLDR